MTDPHPPAFQRTQQGTHWHCETADFVAGLLQASGEAGLTAAAIAERKASFGSNRLTEAPPVSIWIRLACQFRDLVIWILIVAAVIAGISGEWIDAVAVLAIVVLNGLIGFTQEERAELALGMEPPEKDIMKRPPRPAGKAVLTQHRGLLVLMQER